MALKAWSRVPVALALVLALVLRSSSSFVSVLSADGEDRTLEQPRWEDERLVTRLDKLLLLEPDVRRLGVKRLIKSSMVFTGDFSSNLRTCKGKQV